MPWGAPTYDASLRIPNSSSDGILGSRPHIQGRGGCWYINQPLLRKRTSSSSTLLRSFRRPILASGTSRTCHSSETTLQLCPLVCFSFHKSHDVRIPFRTLMCSRHHHHLLACGLKTPGRAPDSVTIASLYTKQQSDGPKTL